MARETPAWQRQVSVSPLRSPDAVREDAGLARAVRMAVRLWRQPLAGAAAEARVAQAAGPRLARLWPQQSQAAVAAERLAEPTVAAARPWRQLLAGAVEQAQAAQRLGLAA
jgi:hypothetical protein